MNAELFKKSPSGRLLKVGQGEAAYWAFMPHPLPPALPTGKDLLRILSDADRALGELAGLGRAMPNPHLLIGPFMRREAVLSSRIEGTQADITVIKNCIFLDKNTISISRIVCNYHLGFSPCRGLMGYAA